MHTKDVNIIHKANLWIEVPNEKTGKHLYANISEVFNRLILPELEKIFAQIESTDKIIRIQRLDIDLNLTNREIVSEEIFAKEILQKIKSQIENVIHQTNTFSESTEFVDTVNTPYFSDEYQKNIEGFIYFLKNGTLPWYFTEEVLLGETASIIESINKHETFFLQRFLELINEDKNVLQNIIAQYDISLVEYIVSLYVSADVFSAFVANKKWLYAYFANHYKVSELKQIETNWILNLGNHLLQNKDISAVKFKEITTQKQINLITSFENLTAENSEKVALNKTVELLKQFFKNDDIEIENSKKRKSKLDNESQKEDLYYSNAGLILLHPFLQYFFKEFDLLDDANKFKDVQSQETAIHLLHYVATFKENVPDFELTFSKYLCGMSNNHITQRNTPLTDKMKAEAKELLLSVIKHWGALKSASPEGLQEIFLQRKAKLILENNGDRLIFEHNATDILLDRLPWSLSIIKLPWLKNMIYAEWR